MIVWKNNAVIDGAQKQRGKLGIMMIDTTLVLSSDYDVDDVKKGWLGKYNGRHKNELSKLPEEVYSEAPEGTIAENYESRMARIDKAAEKYHRLMLNDNGRNFLCKELGIIFTWGNSMEIAIHPSSNQGKK